MPSPLDSIVNAVKDCAELTVMTFTGDISAALSANKSKIEWDKLLEKSAGDAAGNLHLAVLTKQNLDGDAVLYKSNSDKISADLMNELTELHFETVNTSNEVRAELVEVVKDGVLSLVKPG